MTQIELKRVYEPAEATDGYRVLVDKLWPRGLTKEEVDYDLWDKELAPSTELREWFHVDREGRWDEFVVRYTAELRNSPAMRQFVSMISAYPKVTLLFASRDEAHNQADVIKTVAEEMLTNQ